MDSRGGRRAAGEENGKPAADQSDSTDHHRSSIARSWLPFAVIAIIAAAFYAGGVALLVADSGQHALEDGQDPPDQERTRAAEQKAARRRQWEARLAEKQSAASPQRYSDFDCTSVPRHRPTAMAKQAIRARLKSPQSARFSPLRETAETETIKCYFMVSGWVEAENSYGVAVRMAYGVKMRYDSGSDGFIIDDVAMDAR